MSVKIYLAHSGSYDYRSELYGPLKHSLVKTYDIFFPHDKENINIKSKDTIALCDLVIAETSYPSTGQGIELGWADANKKPILCFYRSGSKISGSLQFVCNSFLEYETSEDMVSKLEEWLQWQFPTSPN